MALFQNCISPGQLECLDFLACVSQLINQKGQVSFRKGSRHLGRLYNRQRQPAAGVYTGSQLKTVLGNGHLSTDYLQQCEVSCSTLYSHLLPQLLMHMADDFIEGAVKSACQLAKHRKSTTLETKDLQLYLGTR